MNIVFVVEGDIPKTLATTDQDASTHTSRSSTQTRSLGCPGLLVRGVYPDLSVDRRLRIFNLLVVRAVVLMFEQGYPDGNL
jgi:hypothetical protein